MNTRANPDKAYPQLRPAYHSACVCSLESGIIGSLVSLCSAARKGGIIVNTVAPALIETDMLRQMEVKPGLIPVGRFGQVEEVADAVLMLARNGYITGQTIHVNGGLYFS